MPRCCLFLLGPLLLLSAAEGERAIETRLASIRVAADAVVATANAEAQGFTAPTTTAWRLELRFAGLLEWSDRWGRKQGDLQLVLLRQGERCYALAANSKEWGGRIHRCDASALHLDDHSLRGDLVVMIDGDPVGGPATITIDASIVESVITGSYRSAGGPHVPEVDGGTVSGDLAVIREVPAASEAPVEKLTDPLQQTWYAQARHHEARVEHAVHSVRALRIARQQGIGLPLAWQLIQPRSVAYPPLPELTRSGRIEDGMKDRPDLKTKLRELSDDGGLDLGDLDDDLGGPTAPRDPAVEAQLNAFLLGQLPALQQRIEARQRQLAATAAPRVQVGSQDVADPLFGPWYGLGPLPAAEDGGSRLPAVGATPRWGWVEGWTCAGPFPLVDSQVETPLIPEIEPATDAGYAVDQQRLKSRGKGATADAIARSGPGIIEAGTGFVRSPPWATFDDHGHHRWEYPLSTWYAVTELQVEGAGERWAGLIIDDRGKLWVNDVLVWTSPAISDPREQRREHLLRIPLRAGSNCLLVRVDSARDDMGFALRFALGSGPQENGAVAAKALAERQAALPAANADTVGWRGDGGGHYGPCDPPLAWDPFTGTNVRWRVPLQIGNATPVVVGERVFTLQEPHTLICLATTDGAELWRTDLDIVLAHDAALQDEAAPIRAAAAKAAAELAALPEAERRSDRAKELDRQVRAYIAFLQQRCGVKGPSWKDETGHTYPTPISDGKHLWVRVNTGALACVDLDGRIVWLVDHGGSTDSIANTSSPLLVGDQLICHLLVDAGEKGDQDDRNIVVAFDAVSGAKRWTTATPQPGPFCGSPIAMRLATLAGDHLDVIVTANGSVLRAGDGELLIPYLGAHEVYGTPLAFASTVVFGPNGRKTAFDLIPYDADTIGVRIRWDVEHLRYFQDGNYGLFHEGLLYYARPTLDVTDAATGALTATIGQPFFCNRAGRGYPPIAEAGRVLFVADNATWFQPTNRPHTSAFPGAMSTILPGERPLVLARNQIERIQGGYAFAGDALYVRGMRALMCFGHTGQDGERYEAETVASELLDQVFPAVPASGPVVEGIAVLPETRGRWATTTGPGRRMLSWLLSGPLPADRAEAVATALASDAAPFADKQVGEVAEVGFRRLEHGNMPEWASKGAFDPARFNGGHLKHIGWNSIMGDRVRLGELAGAPRAGQMAILATALQPAHPGTWRLALDVPGSRAWIGGKAVAHNQVVALPVGTVSLVVAVPLDGDAALQTAPQLWPSHGDADRAAWLATTDRCADHLQRCVDLSPGSAIGRRCAEALDARQDE